LSGAAGATGSSSRSYWRVAWRRCSCAPCNARSKFPTIRPMDICWPSSPGRSPSSPDCVSPILGRAKSAWQGELGTRSSPCHAGRQSAASATGGAGLNDGVAEDTAPWDAANLARVAEDPAGRRRIQVAFKYVAIARRLGREAAVIALLGDLARGLGVYRDAA
jgi:hypothetical protein